MKIRRLKLRGFGRFHNGVELTFRDDAINVVAGDNEAGKSTLVDAIYGLLFGLDSADKRRLEPWGDCEAYAGEMEIAAGADAYRIERDFKTNHCTISRLRPDGEETVFDGDANPRARARREYQETLESLIGLSSGEVARCSSMVLQLNMETEITDEVKRLVSGAGDEDYQHARERLRAQYDQLTRRNPWGSRAKQNDREIEKTAAEIDRLQEQREEARRHLERVAALEEEVERLRAELERTSAERERNERVQQNLNRLTELDEKRKEQERELAEIEAERAKIDKAKARLAELKRMESERFPSFEKVDENFPQQLNELAAARARLAEAQRRAQEQEEARRELVQRIDELEERLRTQFAAFVDLPPGFPEKLAAFREKERRLREIESKADALRGRLTELEAQVAEHAERFPNAGEDFPEQVRALKAAEQELEQRTKELEALRKQRGAAEQERAAIHQRLEQEFDDIQEADADVRERLVELSRLRAQAEDARRSLQQAKAPAAEAEARWSRVKWMLALAGVVGVLLGVAISYLTDKPALLYYLPPILGVMGFLLISHFFGSARHESAQARAAVEARTPEALAAESAQNALARQLGPLAEFEELEDQFSRLDEHHDLLRRARELQDRIESLPDEGPMEEAIAQVRRRIDELTEALGPAAERLSDEQALLDEFRRYQALRREAEQIQRELAVVLDADESGRSAIDRLRAELDAQRGELKGLEKKDDEETVQQFRECQNLKAERERLRSQLKSLEDSLSEARGQVDDARRAVADLEEALGGVVGPDTDLKALSEQYGEYLDLKQEAAAAEAVAGSEEDSAKLEERRRAAFAAQGARLSQIEELLAEAPYLRQWRAEPELLARKAEEVRREAQSARSREEELGKALRSKEIELEAVKRQQASDLNEIDAALEALRERLKRLERQEAALKLAIDTLDHVVSEYQKQHVERIADQASHIFTTVTLARYERVQVKEGFVPVTIGPDGRAVELESLSRGARDQLYLALRVAIARELSARAALPFIMDDPFVNFDDARLEAARTVLETIVRTHQVILLTHDRRCQRWPGAYVIPLPSPR